MKGILYKKNAVITGANRGIGNAILKNFALAGANVWAIVRESDPRFYSQINALSDDNGIWIKVLNCELSDTQAIKRAMNNISKEKLPVDILVNNAGIAGGNFSFQMTPLEEMRKVFEINYFAPMLITQYISRLMARNKSGSIINIASVAGIDGTPGQIAYCSSKAAIIGATKNIASELGKYGIRVNAVAPGMTETSMIDQMTEELRTYSLSKVIMNRFGKAVEIADTVTFLASDQSSFITGQVIRVDGGCR